MKIFEQENEITDKIKLITKGHNIFVNPAWNWGVEVSKNENLVILYSKVLKILKNVFSKVSQKLIKNLQK